jgi:hypothetical protein
MRQYITEAQRLQKLAGITEARVVPVLPTPAIVDLFNSLARKSESEWDGDPYTGYYNALREELERIGLEYGFIDAFDENGYITSKDISHLKDDEIREVLQWLRDLM